MFSSFIRSTSYSYLRKPIFNNYYYNSYNNYNYLWSSSIITVSFILSLFYQKKQLNANSSTSIHENNEKYVYKVVLTGGPCGGKSTAMSRLSTRLKSLGYEVYLVPEVATMLITGGIHFGEISKNRQQWIELQAILMGVQRKLEDSFEQLAKLNDKKSVLLCDRGLCDNRAYLPKEDFDLCLDIEGLKLIDIRDKRYDVVFHLVTAAIGAEKFYTTANNAARTETVEQARALDYKTLEAWLGHPELHVIDNSTGFEDKINRVVNGISTSIGAIPKYPEHKYIVLSYEIPDDLKIEYFTVETVIFELDGNQMRAIRRTQGSNSTYMLTSSSDIDNEQNVVLSRQISGREYMSYYQRKQGIVRKSMTYFLWDGKYYALNEYQTNPVLRVLEIEAPTTGDSKTLIPPFIRVGKEVTKNKEYTTEYLAKNKKKDRYYR